MRIRYFSYLTLFVAAAFLVVARYAFTLPTVTALALAFGIGMLALSIGVVARYRRDIPSVMIGSVIGAVSAWTIVMSQVFSDPTVANLTFASAVAVGGLSLIGLTTHELDTERVVHRLEVLEGEGQNGRRRTPQPRAAA